MSAMVEEEQETNANVQKKQENDTKDNGSHANTVPVSSAPVSGATVSSAPVDSVPANSAPVSSVAESNAPESSAELAQQLKQEGNDKYRNKDYAEAINIYTKCLDLDPTNHVFFSNRSAAYLRLQKSEQALDDANKCIELLPTWPKGYGRKVEVLQELKRWDEAVGVCIDGLAACNDDKETEVLKKKRVEIKRLQFAETLSGQWYGMLSEELGGDQQEMNFIDHNSVIAQFMGQRLNCKYTFDCEADPCQMDIQLLDVPDPQMGMPPPILYILKFEDSKLHLCCPFMSMERPTSFQGPGYTAFSRGPPPPVQLEDLSDLSRPEKLERCTKEILEAFTHLQGHEISPQDSPEVMQAKVFEQVKFESALFKAKQKFGDQMLMEIMDATKGCHIPELQNSESFRQLQEKILKSGIMSGEQEAEPGGSCETNEDNVEQPADASGIGDDMVTIAVVGTIVLAVSTAVLFLWRRRKC